MPQEGVHSELIKQKVNKIAAAKKQTLSEKT